MPDKPIKVKPVPLTVAEALRLVMPIDREPLRFFVPSRTPGQEPHLVDLEENGFNGACSCRDFDCRRAPLLKEPGAKPSAASRCWHIQVCRTYFLNQQLRWVAKAANGGQP